MRLLSFGAGTQSTALLLMSLEGELPPLVAAIFADTGDEPEAVYRHLDAMTELAWQADVPIYRVSSGHITRDAFTPGRFASMPLYVRNRNGSRGMIRRQCTREYKINCIRRKARALLAAAGERVAEQWIGVSLDEWQRMKPSGVRYLENAYPLVDGRLSRWDCALWLRRRGYPDPPRVPARSAPSTTTATGGG